MQQNCARTILNVSSMILIKHIENGWKLQHGAAKRKVWHMWQKRNKSINWINSVAIRKQFTCLCQMAAQQLVSICMREKNIIKDIFVFPVSSEQNFFTLARSVTDVFSLSDSGTRQKGGRPAGCQVHGPNLRCRWWHKTLLRSTTSSELFRYCHRTSATNSQHIQPRRWVHNQSH